MLQKALQEHFGFDRFRPPQEEIIQHILAGRDTLAIMPTGGGKSLCYQLPALMLDGVALVISPLIALMKDQVDALRSRNLPAAFINSTQNYDEQRQVLEQMRQGAVKLVYVSPERFRASAFTQTVAQARLSFVAVDEAHCLSQWGHDFRPDYLRIGQALQLLGRPPVAAFTATATPEVREDIRTHLQMRQPVEIVYGFARPNLSFQVEPVASKQQKIECLLRLIHTHQTGIIYCATRKSVVAVHEQLLIAGCRKMILYHGGMSDEERTRAQEEFLSARASVAVATNAFGMGIDRPDIRFVAHYEMPGSVEAYYQEGGRAGRDGRPAVCQLLFNYSDKRVQEFFLEGANPTPQIIRDVYRTLLQLADAQHEIRSSIDELAARVGEKVNPMAVGSSLSVLGRLQAIERFDIPGKRIRGTRLLQPHLKPADLAIDTEALHRKRERDEHRLEQILKYCYAHRCRQQWILSYFGEKNPAPCGCCDVCQVSPPLPGRNISGEELTVVRKALSGVARMSDRIGPRVFRPRYGRRRIIQCLLGSKAADLQDSQLTKLSTYGLLKNEGRRYVTALFQQLEKHGLVEILEGEMPLLGLTDLGVRVLFGEEELHMELPERSAKKEDAPQQKNQPGNSKSTPGPAVLTLAAAADQELLQQLKAKRQQLAAIRKVPPYTIFHNKVLEALARHKPTSKEAALLLPGIGEGNAKYLGPFLEIIRQEV